MQLPQEREMSLRDLVIVFRKRRSYVIGTTLVVVALCALYCAVSIRRYQATGIIQVQQESSSGLNVESLLSESAGQANPLETDIIIATQTNILKSDTLALRTIKDLHLERTAEFMPHDSLHQRLRRLLSLSFIAAQGPPDQPGVPLENAPQRLQSALSTFKSNLTVKPISGSRLIEVNYLNRDPKLAAAVVNDLMQGLADFSFQTRFNATNQASSWLAGQLVDLRQQSEDLQQKVVDLEHQSGVFSLGTLDAQGHEEAYSGVLNELEQDTAALSVAQQNTILRGAIARAAESGNAEMLSGLAGNALASTGASGTGLALVQTLRQQQAQQQTALREAETKFGPAYPKLGEMRASLAALDRAIADEVGRIKSRAESDYVIAQQTENQTRARYDRDKAAANVLNDKAVEYVIARQEAEESRSLYQDLLRKLKEAGISEGLRSTNISVVDPGRVPASPAKPNVPLYMLASLGGGLFLGSLVGLVADALDSKVGSIQQVEEITGQTLLGATPFVAGIPRFDNQATALIAINDPGSIFSEAMRSIRTAILLTVGSPRGRVILVTSSIASEGKSFLASNLAVVLAQAGRKVLLVDADMRRGTMNRLFKASKGPGLSELLSDLVKQPPLLKTEELPQLDVLLSGTPPPKAADLLDAHMAKWIEVWRESYDFIVLDGPPLLPVTDAHILHGLADISLLVTRSGLTDRAQLQRSYRALVEPQRHFVGVIVNGLRPRDESYYGYYGYKKYGYHYNSEDSNEKS